MIKTETNHPIDIDGQGIFSIARVKQMMLAALVASAFSVLNLASQGLFTGMLLQLAFIAFLVISLILVHYQKTSLSISIFLYSSAFTFSLIILNSDAGLYDVAIALYPIIVIGTTLIGSIIDIVFIYLISTAFIILIGNSTIEQWDVIKKQEIDYAHTVNIVLLLFISGFISIFFSKDFKKILEELSIENKRLNESHQDIHQLAHYDQLTKLPNRVMAHDTYKQLVADIDFKQFQLILCFIDLDNFKEINDSFSHCMGDEILIEIAKRLSAITQSHDIASRLGGDEFLLIVKKPKDFRISRFTQILLDKITQPYAADGTEIEVTASIGVAAITEPGLEFEEASGKADLAMYKAKQQGKNTVQHYDAALREENVRRSTIIMGLKKSVKNNWLELYFQPKVDLITHQIVGAEALLRWTKENTYRSSPDEFIPLIESTDIIIEIGEWVIRQACLNCKQWHDAGFTDMHIAVNISVMQLLRNNFKCIVKSALSDANIPAYCLEIELTEYLLINKTDHILSQLEEIKSMGVKLAIDDFGTGYSSLSYLTKFKVDTLKLDKSFVQQISHSPKNLSIVTAIISMAKIINLSTVAEGIETVNEHIILKQLGCQYGQGYLWSKPVPSDIFLTHLHSAKINDSFL